MNQIPLHPLHNQTDTPQKNKLIPVQIKQPSIPRTQNHQTNPSFSTHHHQNHPTQKKSHPPMFSKLPTGSKLPIFSTQTIPSHLPKGAPNAFFPRSAGRWAQVVGRPHARVRQL